MLFLRRDSTNCVLASIPDVVAKLFKDIAPRFANRSGGYTRIIKTRRRLGDGAEMVAIELVSQAEPATDAEQKAAS